MTAAANIKAGSRILASMIANVAPLAGYKSSDQSVTSSTTLVNDNALTISVLASATYFWVMLLDYEGGTRGSSDLKISMSVPAAATARFWMGRQDAAGTNTSSFMGSQSTTYAAGTNGAGVLTGLLAVGTLAVSVTAGSFTLQWAQNTSSGTATIVHAQSVLAAWQIAL